MIAGAMHLPAAHAADCLGIHEVHTHGGYSPTRANIDSVICRSIALYDYGKGEYQMNCYVRDNSPVWTDSEWGMTIMALVEPHLTEAPWRQKKAKER